MRLLTFSTLFPNAEKQNHGIFVQTRLRNLLTTPGIASRVVAPVPWFPSGARRFGEYGAHARVPAREERFGIDVLHPRFPVLPKIGMSLSPLLLAAAVKPTIARMIDEGYDFDLIDAHYFYPDGVAAVKLGRYFNKPVVITARGSDITLIPQYALPRRMVQWAAHNAQGIITVCLALKEALVELGVPAHRIVSLRNGVDLKLFQPRDRATARAALDMTGFTLLSVGRLDRNKANDLTISALPMLPDVRLMIAGAGPERDNLEQLARKLGVADRVRFLGAVPQPELPAYYGAADAMVLASAREGWANVLLEAMACGTPVVASNVWGTPEVVAAPPAGLLMSERTPQALAAAVTRLRENYPSHADTRRYAEGFSWDDTTRGQIALFEKIIDEFRH